MIVHPIGMMRANAAASGLPFVDDFASSGGHTYTAGDSIYVNTNYTDLPTKSFGAGFVISTPVGKAGLVTGANNRKVGKFTGATLSNDRSFEVTLDQAPVGWGNNYHFCLRFVDDLNWISFRVYDNKLRYITKYIAGSFTSLGTDMNQVLSNGDVIKGVIVGDTVEVFYNGVSKATFTDATLLGPGGALETGDIGWWFDAIHAGVTTPPLFGSWTFDDE